MAFYLFLVQSNSIVDICSATEENGESGFMRSPNYPGGSIYQLQCNCELSTQPYSAITLKVLDFHSQTSGCDHNKLAINHNGQTNTFCGEKAIDNNEINAESNKVTVTFQTEGGGSTGGFWLKYQGQLNVALTEILSVSNLSGRTTC